MIAEVSHPTEECPEPLLWNCHDDIGSEVEVSEFLGSLVRLLKPVTVVETGCYLGYTTLELAKAIKENGRGMLYSCDPDKLAWTTTRNKLTEANLMSHVRLLRTTGETVIRLIGPVVNLAFLDSGFNLERVNELRVLTPKLAPYGVIAVHDTGSQHHLRAPLHKAAADLGLTYLSFATPRGLSLFGRKTW